MDLAPDFKELLEEFARCEVEFVIVGGYAVAFHGRPRATKDIDIVLVGGDDSLERAKATSSPRCARCLRRRSCSWGNCHCASTSFAPLTESTQQSFMRELCIR